MLSSLVRRFVVRPLAKAPAFDYDPTPWPAEPSALSFLEETVEDFADLLRLHLSGAQPLHDSELCRIIARLQVVTAELTATELSDPWDAEHDVH